MARLQTRRARAVHKCVKVMLYFVRFVDSVRYDLWGGYTLLLSLRSSPYALLLHVLDTASLWIFLR